MGYRWSLSERCGRGFRSATGTASALAALVVLAELAGCGVSTQGTRTVPPESTPPPPAPGVPGEPQQPTLPAQPPPGTQTDVRYLRYRYSMDSPPNDDFTVELPEIFFYIRPFEDYVSMKVQGRKQNRVRILWLDSEFTDILGRRYRLVPPNATLMDAANSNVPPTDIEPDGLFNGKVLLIDMTQAATVRNLGTTGFPVVPRDAGPPEQVKGKTFTLRLEVELNYVRQSYDFIYSITDTFYR
ncbi:MAG TPA: hypothetical protein VNM87_13570 [Candidatus Udaeobacter sp.]|nr:hypothetical protein [Candidatus Udaeobacter sp.]